MFALLNRYREPLLVMAMLVLPLISFLSSGRRGRDPNFIDRGIVLISTPLQSAMTWLIQGTTNQVDSYVALKGAHVEAQDLRKQLAETQAELHSLKEAQAENERLKQVLNYVETTIDQEILAQVVGKNPSAQFQSVRINRGEADGIAVGMPVVTPLGVVGHVVRVVANAADVMLLTDPASRVASLVQRNRIRATTAGSGDGQWLNLELVRREDDVIEGDVLVTAGTDGIFPKGLRVGTVKSVTRPPSGMFLAGKVTPAVDTDRLEEVLIVPLTLNGAAVVAPPEGQK